MTKSPEPEPSPKPEAEKSGRITLRMEPALHADIANAARDAGMDLNGAINYLIRESLPAFLTKAREIAAARELAAPSLESLVAKVLRTAFEQADRDKPAGGLPKQPEPMGFEELVRIIKESLDSPARKPERNKASLPLPESEGKAS